MVKESKTLFSKRFSQIYDRKKRIEMWNKLTLIAYATQNTGCSTYCNYPDAHIRIFMIKAIKLPTGSNYHSHLFHTPTCSSTVQGYFWWCHPDFTFNKETSRLVSGLKELGTLGKWICEVRQWLLTESFILIFQPRKCMFCNVRKTKGSSGQSYKSNCWVKHMSLSQVMIVKKSQSFIHEGMGSVWCPVVPKRPAPSGQALLFSLRREIRCCVSLLLLLQSLYGGEILL